MGKVEHFPGLPPAATSRMAAKLLNKHSPHEIAEAIHILIDVLDLIGGDVEAEDATDAEDDFTLSPMALRYAERGPGCAVADEDGSAYVEWLSLPKNKRGGQCRVLGHEDDEEDDPGEDSDPAEHDDPDSGADDEGEREQMPDDVPVLPVWSAEHNIFTDARVSLGLSNLQSSFRTNGGEVRSADSGDVLVTHGDSHGLKPGAPA